MCRLKVLLVGVILWTQEVDAVCIKRENFGYTMRRNAQNPLDTFPRKFPVDGEFANLLRAC